MSSVLASEVAETSLNGSYTAAVAAVLDELDAPSVLQRQSRILIKPNLVNASRPPITTPVACTGAVVEYVCRHAPGADVVVAEGCGALELETDEVFEELGYTALVEKHGIRLVDLNRAPTVKLENARCSVFPEFHMPAIAMDHFIISVPVLKAHTLAGVTLSMKNMMGFAPPKFYNAGSWKKSAFHARMQQSLLDLNAYRRPDLTVLDAGIGMAEAHLGGPTCEPPVNRVLAGFDAVAVDRRGCELLGVDWRTVEHIAGAGSGNCG